MKITSVTTYLVEYPLARGLANSFFEYRSRETLLIKIATDEGLSGWGETAPMAGVQSLIEDRYAPLLKGQDPRQHRKLWRQLWGPNFGNGVALGGVDMALHDLRGKMLGLSVADLYGGRVRDRVPAYASSVNYTEGCEPEENYPADARDLVERGFRTIKLRIGRFAPRREIPILEAVREAIGPEVRLTVDVNGAYSMPTAIEMGRALEALGAYWFEEPLAQEDYAGYETLASTLDIAVAGGECVGSRFAARDLIVRRAVDIIQPDVSLCGGFAECLAIAEIARLWSIPCIPHCWGGAPTIAATLQLLALLPDTARSFEPDVPLLELDVTENPFREKIVRQPIVVREGFVDIPTGPGLGIEIDEEIVRQYVRK